jgi:acyl-CoA thioesterase-1
MQTVIEYFDNNHLLKKKDDMKLYSAKAARAVSCAIVFLIALFACAAPSHAQIVALGASVVEGYGVNSGEAFPEQLQAMLRAKGKQYTVTNRGISGDTTSGVLSRLDSAVPEGTRIVILLIGGNDVRRGGSVADARAGVGQIVSRLQARHIRVINAMPYYKAARGKGMVLPDGIHLTPAGQKYMASALASSIN